MTHFAYRFWILTIIVAMSGFSQGMLLPLIAVILEQSGVSSSINGLHATGLYLGVLIASPFMEKPLRRFGFKPVIMAGGLLVLSSLAFFPLWESLWFWFLLRLFIGIGDHMLHFGTQTWITSTTPQHKLGRNIAIYGFFFGLGFTAGPVMTRFAEVDPALPFFLSSGASLIIWLSLFTIRNELPHKDFDGTHEGGTFKRFAAAWKIGWAAFLPPFAYGFLEASLHGNFPVYALRTGIDVSSVSIILPAFAGGSLISQLPLGVLSDRIGRRKVLLYTMFSGTAVFVSAGFIQHSAVLLFTSFLVAGMLVGSVFSLGISYMTDLLPKHLLPAGNLMCGISFSVGSILGPFLGGLAIELLTESFFFVISSLLLIISLLLLFYKKEKLHHTEKLNHASR